MNLPNDPVMLLSVVNTALRDRGLTLSAFAKEAGVEESTLTEKLAQIGYVYDPEGRQFK